MLIPVDIVQYSKNKSFKNAKTVWDKKGGGLRAIKKLKPNTTYYIRYSITTDVSTLKGYKKIGGIWSKTIKVKTKNTITSDTQSLLKLIVTLKIITFKL